MASGEPPALIGVLKISLEQILLLLQMLSPRFREVLLWVELAGIENIFYVDAAEKGRCIAVAFDGIYMNADIWVNDHHGSRSCLWIYCIRAGYNRLCAIWRKKSDSCSCKE